MKNILALLLVLMLAFTFTFGAFAEAAATETEAEETEEVTSEEVVDAALKVSEEMADETAEESAEEQGTTMYVAAKGGLMIREAADLNSKAIMSVMVNRTVTVLSTEGDWAKVRFDWTECNTTVEGYMWAGYLSEKPVKIVKKTRKASSDPTPLPQY